MKTVSKNKLGLGIFIGINFCQQFTVNHNVNFRYHYDSHDPDKRDKIFFRQFNHQVFYENTELSVLNLS